MSRWQGQLGGLHQFRCVPYVVHSEGLVRCLLCDTGWMNVSSRINHFHGSRHAKRYFHVKRMEREERAMLEHLNSLKRRISVLGLKAWRDAVTECIKRGAIGEAENLLKKLEQMERLCLLDLAVLKAKTIDGVIFRNTTEILEQQALDPEFNASAYLKLQRVVCGSEVIVPAVARFL